MRPAASSASIVRRAQRHGILPVFQDASGRLRRASPTTLRRLLDAIETAPAAGGAVPLPPVIRLRVGTRVLRWRAAGARNDRGPAPLAVRLAGERRWQRVASERKGVIRFPSPLPAGCHEFRWGRGPRASDHLLVVAPLRLPASRRRRWGLFAPVYALRGAGTWGCGDLSALEQLGRWAARMGATVVATLPLLPAFLDRGRDPSPYRPVSRRFWNEVYLDVTRTPEFRRSVEVQRWVASAEFRRRIARLERRGHVDFHRVARLKRKVVERLLVEFDRAPAARRAAYRRFVDRTEGVEAYARFRARAEPRRPRGSEYHLFAQWLIDEQLHQVARRLGRRGVDLCLDLPLGVHPGGFDAARDAALYAAGVHIGSPPDPGAPAGQVWGFAPWVPERLRRAGYRPFVEAIRHPLTVARFLRIDHVLGFHRQFWVPAGAAAGEGAYVRYPMQDLYAIVVAEAARAGATIIGEDLGTVPPEVRPALARHGLLGLYVAELEWDGPVHRPIHRDVAVAVDTHDQLPFRAYWDRRAAAKARSRSPSFPFVHLTPMAAFRRAVLDLAASPARLLLVNVEDLWGETRVQNVPGESGAGVRHFSRRFRRSLDELRNDAGAGELLCAIGSMRGERHARCVRPTRRPRHPPGAVRRPPPRRR